MNAATPERRFRTEEISGVIGRVTFHDEESGLCVLGIKTRDIGRLSIPIEREGQTFDEAVAWQYYVDHLLVLGSVIIRSISSVVGSTSMRRVVTFLTSRLMARARLYGSAYTRADLLFWGSRYDTQHSTEVVRDVWTLLRHRVGLALVLRDEGASLLKAVPPRNKAALEKFAEAYRLAFESGKT